VGVKVDTEMKRVTRYSVTLVETNKRVYLKNLQEPNRTQFRLIYVVATPGQIRKKKTYNTYIGK